MTDFKFPFELEAWRIVQQQPTKLEVLEEDDPTHHLSDDSSAPLLPGPASRRRPSASPAEYHLPKPGLAAGISAFLKSVLAPVLSCFSAPPPSIDEDKMNHYHDERFATVRSQAAYAPLPPPSYNLSQQQQQHLYHNQFQEPCAPYNLSRHSYPQPQPSHGYMQTPYSDGSYPSSYYAPQCAPQSLPYIQPLRQSDLPNRGQVGSSFYPESSTRTSAFDLLSPLPPPSRPPFRSSVGLLPPGSPPPALVPAIITKKLRAPRQETLREIKHMIFTFRIDPWQEGDSPVSSRGPRYLRSEMDPPLLSTFRAFLAPPNSEPDEPIDEETPSFPHTSLPGEDTWIISALPPLTPVSEPRCEASPLAHDLGDMDIDSMCFDVKPHIEDPTPTDLTLPAIAGPFSMVGMSLPPLATFFPYHETNPDPEPAIDTALIFQEDGDRNYLGAAADKEPEHDVLLDESLLGSLFTSINVPAPRNHVCKTCGKAFERPSTLQTHMSVHSGERPHECPIPTCRRLFSFASNLRRHIRTHGSHHPRSPPPTSVLAVLKKKSGMATSKRRRAVPSYSDDDSGGYESEEQIDVRRGSKSQQQENWIPESLRNVTNASKLSHKPPFDLSSCSLVCVPLPPVQPWGTPHSASAGRPFEERNSYDTSISETPYHPTQWVYRPILPGPALVDATELTSNSQFARRLMFTPIR